MPESNERFVVEPHVLHQRVGEGVLVVNTRTLTYVELDSVGADMWESLTTLGNVDAAVNHLEDLYDIDPATLRVDLMRMVTQWVDLGVAAYGPVDSAAPSADRDDAVAPPTADPVDLYLNLMVKALCGLTSGRVPNRGDRLSGRDVPIYDPGVYTLIGTPRLRNIRALMERALDDDVPGDFMECGVWRGGAGIFMRAVLAARHVTDRTVWLADSFQGLPAVPAAGHPLDLEEWSTQAGLIPASQDEVRANFEVFDLLDDQVRLLAGWFDDSLPQAEVQELAVLRLDADLYASTMTALTHLYPKVAAGGFVIIDDYEHASCRQAVHDYIEAHHITVDMHPIDWTGVWWRKPD